jgi:LRR receptor-like serine/threonine-protein kinase FLS2
MIVAIKVFDLVVEGAFKSFDTECGVLRNIRHRNLLKIISTCSNMDFKAFVLEYMPNGNLEKWLYSQDHCLSILQRLNITINVASALEYLHYGYSIPIVHCDLKPNNILLDEDLVAHVADFGIAKLLGDGDSMMQTMTLATIGYMAPGDVFTLQLELESLTFYSRILE